MNLGTPYRPPARGGAGGEKVAYRLPDWDPIPAMGPQYELKQAIRLLGNSIGAIGTQYRVCGYTMVWASDSCHRGETTLPVPSQSPMPAQPASA
jgi:hypothetical protein